jgi:excisionase family DNA binding protein
MGHGMAFAIGDAEYGCYQWDNRAFMLGKGEKQMEKLYTTEEVAEILKVSPRTIRREREDANLNFIRIRGQIRYREEDIKKYLAENSWDEQVKMGAE